MREIRLDGEEGAEREAFDRCTMAESCTTEHRERSIAAGCSSSPMVRRHVQQVLPRPTVYRLVSTPSGD